MRLLVIATLVALSSTFLEGVQAEDKSQFHHRYQMRKNIAKSEEDPCASVPSLSCLRVRRCDDASKPIATINQYWLTNVQQGQFIAPAQATNATICYMPNEGFTIHECATDSYAFTPFTTCNSYVWQKGSALEMMIFPVRTPFDVPEYYYEIDMAPSGATFGSMIFNNKGNVTNCNTCVAEQLDCKGANTFTSIPDMKLSAEYDTVRNGTRVGWHTSRFLPFSMFHELKDSTKLFKFNLYRYDYPWGENQGYELSGYSPTWNPSFHIPSRFALMVLEA